MDKKSLLGSDSLVDFIFESPTPFHVVKNTAKLLEEKGFKKLVLKSKWKLKPNNNYFVENNSSMIAFKLGNTNCDKIAFNIVGSHSDSPGIKIKPNPEILSEGYLQLNTEIYGGPLLYTWFDRPLSIAGRVFLKDKNNIVCKLINFKKPLAILPSLAIHMNREVNTTGLQINSQKDILPVLKNVCKNFEKTGYLLNLIAGELSVKKDDIIDFELFFYDANKGNIIGDNNCFISSARLDNLEGLYASIIALCNSRNKSNKINMLVCFDNEEIGSTTNQGADSQLLSNILERIVYGLGGNRENFLRSIPDSFIISVDAAHSVHPTKTDKADITNKSVINMGPIIKISANKRYSSDSESISFLKDIADKNSIPLQFFVNNSNEKGGSTIGPISATHLEMLSIDIGVPMLSMHSIRELIGVNDHSLMIKLLTNFYNKRS